LNQGFTYSEVIGRGGEGVALLAHLVGTRTHTPEEEWCRRIEAGAVLVDSRRAAPDQVLRRGQVVEWLRPPWDEPPAPLTFAVLFEDGDLVAVAKPPDLPTLPGGGFLEHTLLHLVRRRYPEASPMHRLGRGTSGIVIFVRTEAAGRAVARSWREGEVTKCYRALVVGHPPRDSFAVEAPIGPMPHPRLGTVHAVAPGGKPSRSEVRVLERREGSSLVEVRIDTGRPHQIRIHMAAGGYPLLGDPLYAVGGTFSGGGTALPGDTGYLLHAIRLVLPHPRTGASLEVWCRPPAPLRLQAEGR